MNLGFSTLVAGTFEEVRQRTIDALKEEGFGVVSEIDVKKTFAEKLGVEFRDFTILGACNPVMAKKAIDAMPEIALLLPCNVTVSQEPEGVRVVAVDPRAMLAVAPSHPAIEEVASDATPRLQRAIAAL